MNRLTEFLGHEITEYIDNEINYIKYNISVGSETIEGGGKDIVKLSKLEDKDIKEIANKIVDNGILYEEIQNLIHNYLYNYIDN